jgi:hypothetical protein
MCDVRSFLRRAHFFAPTEKNDPYREFLYCRTTKKMAGKKMVCRTFLYWRTANK